MTRFASSALAELFDDVKAAGWTWRKGRHVVVYPPDGGRPLILSCTAYDGPATKTTVGQFRRRGLRTKRRENR